MNRFAPVLKRLDAQLPLSQRSRARVLLEIAADLDDAFNLALEEGMSEAEAEAAAVDAFQPSPEAVAQLVRIHGSRIAGILDGVSEQGQVRWTTTLFSVISMAALLLTGRILMSRGIFNAGGVWVWVSTGLCAASLLVAGVKVCRLFVVKDQRPRTLSRGLGLVALCAFAQASTGLGLVVIDSFSWLTALISVWPGDPQGPLRHLLATSALATIALCGAIVSALAWFLLSQRVAHIEVQEAQLLFQLERNA